MDYPLMNLNLDTLERNKFQEGGIKLDIRMGLYALSQRDEITENWLPKLEISTHYRGDISVWIDLINIHGLQVERESSYGLSFSKENL